MEKIKIRICEFWGVFLFQNSLILTWIVTILTMKVREKEKKWKHSPYLTERRFMFPHEKLPLRYITTIYWVTTRAILFGILCKNKGETFPKISYNYILNNSQGYVFWNFLCINRGETSPKISYKYILTNRQGHVFWNFSAKIGGKLPLRYLTVIYWLTSKAMFFGIFVQK